jgi:tRNA pseudouridine55 synthase
MANDIINGWLNINKDKCCSSAKVVAILKRKLNVNKIGHGGTLDPLAVGVLPICIGNATKQTNHVMNCDKEYLFNIKFGKNTTTGDEEGSIIDQNNFIPKENEILKQISSFVGNIKQTPPIFSAIKVNGKRAYQLARKKEEFSLKERDVIVYDLQFRGWKTDDEIQMFVKCGKGFYIRALASDFAKSIGALGYTSYLERVSVGCFNQSNIQNINDITSENINNYLIYF